MNPLHRIADNPDTRIRRLTTLVEVLLVYIIVVTGVGGYYMLGLIDSNKHRANDVTIGLTKFVCGAALARMETVVSKPEAQQDAINNFRAAQGYIGVLPDIGISPPYPGPKDRMGEVCPYPRLRAQARAIAVDAAKKKP